MIPQAVTTAVELDDELVDVDAELESAVADAFPALDAEMNELLRFKTATLGAYGVAVVVDDG